MSPDTRDSAEPGRSLTRAERESLARERLAAELVAVPPIDSPALRTRLRDAQGSAAIASGALVLLLRAAVRAHDASLVEELFMALLHRLEGPNTRWAVCVVAQTPAARSMRQSIREDLKQELTLHLWQRLARESDPAWELYFGRALAFAQRRVARSYMRRNGYWPASAQPEALPALLLSRLARYAGDDETPANDLMAASDDPLAVADLADLRALVLRDCRTASGAPWCCDSGWGHASTRSPMRWESQRAPFGTRSGERTPICVPSTPATPQKGDGTVRPTQKSRMAGEGMNPGD